MERKTTIEEAKKIMGQNFIGPEELMKISKSFKLSVPKKNLPAIPFIKEYLKKTKDDYILVLGISKDKEGNSLTINRMREFFGIDPKKSEPCFYNQDWYLNEKFSFEKTLENRWYLIRKTVDEKTSGKKPEEIENQLSKDGAFPSAILVTFTFFVYYLLTDNILWEKNFIWCIDKDSNGDRIYVGRYIDEKGINKNGFNIHRHLSIKHYYGLASEII